MQNELEIKRLAAKFDVLAYRLSYRDGVERNSICFLCKFDNLAITQTAIERDVLRCRFIGNNSQYARFLSIWSQRNIRSYAQGNAFCAFPKLVFSDPQFLVNPEKIKFTGLEFAFLNGYDLILMSQFPDSNPEKAKIAKIYIDGATRVYKVLGPDGLLKCGNLPEEIDLNNLADNLNNAELKTKILAHTSREGHTLLNKQGIECGLNIKVRTNDPRNWMIGIIINGTAMPKDRDVILYLTPYKPWEIQEPEVDLKNMLAATSEFSYFNEAVSIPQFLSSIAQEIHAEGISSLITMLIEADGTINIPLVEIISQSLTLDNTELDTILTICNSPKSIQTVLNTRAIMGCKLFLSQFLANLPHNTDAKEKIIQLLRSLEKDPIYTFESLFDYLARTDEITTEYSATSCLLSTVVECKFLRAALNLAQHSKESLADKDQRIICLEQFKSAILTQKHLISDLNSSSFVLL